MQNLLQLLGAQRVHLARPKANLELARPYLRRVECQTLHLEGHDLVAAIGVLELAAHFHNSVLLKSIGEVVILEAHAFAMARRILQHEVRHLLALFGELDLHARNEACERRRRNVAIVLGQIAQAELRDATQSRLVLPQRMIRDINLQNLFLVRQKRALIPLDAIGRRNIFGKA